jgi:hypothetical protein
MLVSVEAPVGEASGPGVHGDVLDVLCLRNEGGLGGVGRLRGRLSGETSLSSRKSGTLASSTLSFTGASRLTEARTVLAGIERDAERAGVENGRVEEGQERSPSSFEASSLCASLSRAWR